MKSNYRINQYAQPKHAEKLKKAWALCLARQGDPGRNYLVPLQVVGSYVIAGLPDPDNGMLRCALVSTLRAGVPEWMSSYGAAQKEATARTKAEKYNGHRFRAAFHRNGQWQFGEVIDFDIAGASSRWSLRHARVSVRGQIHEVRLRDLSLAPIAQLKLHNKLSKREEAIRTQLMALEKSDDSYRARLPEDFDEAQAKVLAYRAKPRKHANRTMEKPLKKSYKKKRVIKN